LKHESPVIFSGYLLFSGRGRYFLIKAFSFFVAVALFLGLILSGCAQTSSSTKVDNLRLVGTIGPLSIPLAYMVDNHVLDSVAQKTTLSIWANPIQLQAIVTGNQADFISLPTNSAATFYNRGISLRLLDASIWNILYLVTPDTQIKSVSDLKGKRVVVPYQGAIPDAMFQHICRGQGLDPAKDLEIFYASDPVQGAQLLLNGKEKYVLLSEPSATSVILNARKSGLILARALNMQTEWQKVAGSTARTPIAGTVVLGSIQNNAGVVKAFTTEYNKAVQWMLENPVQAGEVGAKVLVEQGFTAETLTESLKNIDWNYVTAIKARKDIEAFFEALSQVSSNYIGGKIPEPAFYYGN
jgi:NitT/TauT family transport system substrate-binding protein